MYKRVDFTNLEGISFTQDLLDFLQTSYRETFAALSGMIGDLIIISGVTDLGANYSDGWVSINGEILPFVGGVKAARIIVEETIATEEFGDGSNKNTYFTKQAKLAIVGGNAFTDFVRLSTLKQMYADILSNTTNKAGKALSTPWTDIPLGAKGEYPGVVTNQRAQYCKDSFGFVHLKGQVKLTASADVSSSADAILNMPDGFEPSYAEAVFVVPVLPGDIFTGNYNLKALRIKDASFGPRAILIDGGVDNDIVYLDGVSYYAG